MTEVDRLNLFQAILKHCAYYSPIHLSLRSISVVNHRFWVSYQTCESPRKLRMKDRMKSRTASNRVTYVSQYSVGVLYELFYLLFHIIFLIFSIVPHLPILDFSILLYIR